MECLDEIKKYQATLSDNEKKNIDDKPPLPIIMTAFNVKTTNDYLLEVIKRIRLRYVSLLVLLDLGHFSMQLKTGHLFYRLAFIVNQLEI